MKILCIGDSLALPGHGNIYEDTWFFKLKKQFPNFDFVSFFQRSLTTNELNTRGVDNGFPYGSDCLEFYNPSLVIMKGKRASRFFAIKITFFEIMLLMVFSYGWQFLINY